MFELPPIDASVPYGARLLPHVLDENAEADPERIVGRMRRSLDPADGFADLNIKDIANAVNFMAFWLEAKLEHVDKQKPFAYLVRRLQWHIVPV